MPHIGISDTLPEPIASNFKVFEKSIKEKLESVSHYPIRANFGLLSKCNMNPRCVMCLTEDSNVMPHDLLMEFEGLFNNAVSIRFTAMGEPTIYPNFIDIVGSIRGWVSLQTNGILLNSLHELLCVLHDLYVSVDASSESTYRNIRGVHFGGVIEGIKKAVLIRDTENSNLFIRMDFVLMKSNFHEVIDFVELAHKLGVNGVYFSSLFPLDIYPNKKCRGEFVFDYEKEILDYNDNSVREILCRAKELCDKYNLIFTGVVYG